MLVPEIVLQPHVGDGYPTLVFNGNRWELTEEELVNWLHIISARIRPQRIVAHVCKCVEDE